MLPAANPYAAQQAAALKSLAELRVQMDHDWRRVWLLHHSDRKAKGCRA